MRSFKEISISMICLVTMIFAPIALAANINDFLIPYVGPTHSTAGTLFITNQTGSSKTITTIVYDFYPTYVNENNCSGAYKGEARGTGSLTIGDNTINKEYSLNGVSLYNRYTGNNIDLTNCLNARFTLTTGTLGPGKFNTTCTGGSTCSPAQGAPSVSLSFAN